MNQPFQNDLEAIELGTVQMWSGTIDTLPPGWVLCDGNNGTLDLTDKFVKGVASATDSPGTVVGQDSYSLSQSQMPSHAHSFTTDPVSVTHSHGLTQPNTAKYDRYGNHDSVQSDDNDLQHTTYETHSHALSLNNSGGGNTIDARPPYYEVAFITKL